VSEFRVELDAFTGPLDLLLYLVKKEEVDITDIPIARVTNQYINYVEWLQHLDPEAAGAFLVMAATLIEIKSRMLLPVPPSEVDDGDWEDPRLEIVRQLIEYKEMKEAASELAVRADVRAGQMGRPGERWAEPETTESTQDKALEDVSLWTLFAAFNDILRQTGETSLMRIISDNTPIEVIGKRLLEQLGLVGKRDEPVSLRELFPNGLNRAQVIGVVLAILELIRQGFLKVQQRERFGEIFLVGLPRDVESFQLPTDGSAGAELIAKAQETQAQVAEATTDQAAEPLAQTTEAQASGESAAPPTETDSPTEQQQP
jgi:segregation and condensation protein A